MRSYEAGRDLELEAALMRFADVVRAIPLGDPDFRAAYADDPVRACQTCSGSDVVVVAFHGGTVCARCLFALARGDLEPAPYVPFGGGCLNPQVDQSPVRAGRRHAA
jgi:hypothetical protein